MFSASGGPPFEFFFPFFHLFLIVFYFFEFLYFYFLFTLNFLNFVFFFTCVSFLFLVFFFCLRFFSSCFFCFVFLAFHFFKKKRVTFGQVKGNPRFRVCIVDLATLKSRNKEDGCKRSLPLLQSAKETEREEHRKMPHQ